jgi:hypothetical protein
MRMPVAAETFVKLEALIIWLGKCLIGCSVALLTRSL